MQFGLFDEAPAAPRYTYAQRFAAMLDLIIYGESLGFDIAWLGESHCGGPFLLLSAPREEVKRTMAPFVDAGMPKV